MFNLEYIVIRNDGLNGIDLDYLEEVLKYQNPLKYIYIVCNGHNPQSTTFSACKRRHLAFLAEKYNFIIIEDDPYCYLSYTNETFLPMISYTKNAIYISSFSKIISPALRVGWIVGSKDIIQRLEWLKDMNDVYTNMTNHLALNSFLELNDFNRIIRDQVSVYTQKRDHMIQCIRDNFKIDIEYSIPSHGCFYGYNSIIFQLKKI